MIFLPSDLVKVVLLSLVGSITPFGLAWTDFASTATAQDAGVLVVTGLAFGFVGLLILGSAIALLVDETHRRSWAALVAVLNGVAEFFAVAIVVNVSRYNYGPPNLLGAFLSAVLIAGSFLGLLGGVLAISLKSHETSRLQDC